MRRQDTSIFVYLLFGILIAVFVYGIAPTGQGKGGCGTQSNSVIEVDDTSANLSAYRIAYSNHFNRLRQRERVYFALETLIRREILANAATERGMRVTGEMVDEEIKKGYFFLGGLRIQLGGAIFDEHEDGTRTWNVRKFKGWVNGLDVQSTSTYRDEQVRSMQAALMYELLTSDIRVSREEALSDFLYQKTTVAYDMVTFSPAPYRAAMRLSDGDVDRYLTAHEADVKARYQQDERLYKGMKPQLKLRSIFIAKLEEKKEPPTPEKPPEQGSGSGSAAGSAAGSGAGAGSGSGSGSAIAKQADKKDPKKAEPKKEPPQPIGMKIEEAKAKLEAARTAIAAGKQKFEDAAKQLATDDAVKAAGGYIGWRTVENAQLGEKAVNDAVKELKPGEMTKVIETDLGAYLVMAEDKREGDLDYDKVKREIASELAKDGYAKEAAKRAALKSIEEARAGTGKNLQEMFEMEAPKGGMPGGLDFLNDPNLTDEQKQQILEQLKNQMPGGDGPHGAADFVWESKDIPVKWSAPDETKGNGSGSAAGSAKAGGSAAKGSAAGSTAGSSAAGSASGSGSGTTPPPPTPGVTTAIPPVEPTTDQLPQFGDVAKPKITRVDATPRRSPLPGLSKELTNVVFDELSAGMLAKRVYEVDGSYVLLQIAAKGQAKVEDFEKDADRYITKLQLIRSFGAVEDWIKQRCMELDKDKRIVPMKDLVRESNDKGESVPQIYQPCMFAGWGGEKQIEWLVLMLPALGYGGGGG